jgi:hypothetical protein
VGVTRTVVTTSSVTRVELLFNSTTSTSSSGVGVGVGGGSMAVVGVRVVSQLGRETSYAITNTDAGRKVPRLYLDHTASSEGRGYCITTVRHRSH